MKIFVPNNIVRSPKCIPHLQYYEQEEPDSPGFISKFSSCRYNAAKGCLQVHCLQRREDSRGWSPHLCRTSPSILMPLGCPVRLQTLTSVHLDFSSGPNYHISHPLLSTLTLVFRQSSVSRLLATPLHPHNFQPSVFSFERPLAPPPFTWRPCHVLNDKH